MQDSLLIIAAPSGAGKTTIVRALLEQMPRLAFSISAASRDPRGAEQDGKDYYFMGVEGFKQAIEANRFLEWEEVYPNQFYGTLKSEVTRLWSEGKAVIFDIDVVGALNLKKQYGSQAKSIFIMPPSMDELENRLRGRQTESEEKINMRIGKANREIERAPEFDVVIVNDDLQTAIEEAKSCITEFLER